MKTIAQLTVILALGLCGVIEYQNRASRVKAFTEWRAIAASIVPWITSFAQLVSRLPVVGDVSRDITIVVLVCMCLDWVQYRRFWHTWTVLTRSSEGNAFYLSQKQFGIASALFYTVVYATLRVTLLAGVATMSFLRMPQTLIFVTSSIGCASGLVFFLWRRKMLTFMPDGTPPTVYPQIDPGDVENIDGQLVVNVAGKLVELDEFSTTFDVRQTDKGLKLNSLTVKPIQPPEQAEEKPRPEASIPGQQGTAGPPPRNAIKLWVRENGKWRVSCTMNFWRDSIKGHVGTTVLHGLAHVAQYEQKDIGITSAVMSEGINGGNPFPLVDFLRSTSFDITTTWQVTNYYGQVTNDTIDECWKQMFGQWQPNISDLVIVTTNVNFAALGVQFFNLKTITSFQATGELYSVCNWDSTRNGYYTARMENDPERVRLQGLVKTSASSWPGTSGSAALTFQKELMYVHAAGPPRVRGEFPNIGYAPTLVKQVVRKHTGGDPRPLYRQGIVHHESALMKEIKSVCDEIDEREQIFDALRKAGTIPADTPFQVLTPEEAELAAIKRSQLPESGVTHSVRRAIIKKVYAKLRRNDKMRGKNSASVYTFIYHKMSDAIPEVDTYYDENDITQEDVDQAERDTIEQYTGWLHGTKWEEYQIPSDSEDSYEGNWPSGKGRRGQRSAKRSRKEDPESSALLAPCAEDDDASSLSSHISDHTGLSSSVSSASTLFVDTKTQLTAAAAAVIAAAQPAVEVDTPFFSPLGVSCVSTTLVESEDLDMKPECGLCHIAGYKDNSTTQVESTNRSCFWQHHFSSAKRSGSTAAVDRDPDGKFTPPPSLGRDKESYLYCDVCNNWEYCRDLPCKYNGGVYPECYCPCTITQLPPIQECQSTQELPKRTAVPLPLDGVPPSPTQMVGDPPKESSPPVPECSRGGTAKKRPSSRRITNKRLSPHGASLVALAATPKTFQELMDANVTQQTKYGFTLTFQRAVETGWLKKVMAGPRALYQACFPESSAQDSCFEHLAFVNDEGQLDYPEVADLEVVQDQCEDHIDQVVEEHLRPLIEIDDASPFTVGEWCNAIHKVGKMLSATGAINYSLSNTKLFRDYLSAETQCSQNDFFGEEDPNFRYIGRAPMPPPGKRRDYVEPEATDLMLAWGLVDEWGRPKGAKPPQGPSHEVQSLKAQLSRKSLRSRGYNLSHLREYSSGLPPPVIDWDQSLQAYTSKLCSRMEASKSSGWSRLTGARTNGEWVSRPQCLRGGLLSVALTMLTDHATLASWTPEQLFRAGLVVPEEASIKDETHMRKKIEAKRWRLIWMTSSRAQFLARFFHDGQNKTELDLYRGGYTHSTEFPYFGSCGGMGHDDEGLKDTCAAFTRLSQAPNSGEETSGLTSLDAKGWDFSVTRTLLMADAWRRAHLAEVAEAPAAFCMGLLNLGLVLSAHVLRSGMAMFAIRVYGIVGSGMISTTASNSFMRNFAHSEAFWHIFGRVARSLANGDDCVGHDRIFKAILDVWEQLGLQLDDEEDIRTHELASFIKFTSHVYSVSQQTASYGNQEKLFLKLALMNASGKNPTAEQLSGIRVAIRNTPDAIKKLDYFIKECCPALVGTDWENVHPDMSLMDA